jgi:hypothetical protein
LCGHSHTAFAGLLEHEDGSVTHVACLDQAARPEGAVFWLEWQDGRAVRAGWGISGEVAWKEGERWNECRTPQAGWAERGPRRPRTARPRGGETSAGGTDAQGAEPPADASATSERARPGE